MVNRISPHMVKRGDMLSQADVIEILALELVGAIPMDDEIVATTNKGMPATLNGRSPAAKAFGTTARRVAGVEIDEVRETGVGFFGRLGRALGLSPA
jgi:septum site-determining protein MinD